MAEPETPYCIGLRLFLKRKNKRYFWVHKVSRIVFFGGGNALVINLLFVELLTRSSCPFRVVLADLHKAGYVICEICKRHACLGTNNSDTAEYHTTPGQPHQNYN